MLTTIYLSNHVIKLQIASTTDLIIIVTMFDDEEKRMKKIITRTQPASSYKYASRLANTISFLHHTVFKVITNNTIVVILRHH